MLLPVGARAYRELDDCWFECTVVGRDEVTKTLSVQYCDDQRIEHELEPQDLAATLPSLASAGNCNAYAAEATQQSNWSLLLSSHEKESVLRRVLEFLDHFEWIRSLVLVQKSWLEEIRQRENWVTIRFPSEIIDQRRDNANVDDGASRYHDTSICPASYIRRLQRLMNLNLDRLSGKKLIELVLEDDSLLVRNVVEHLGFNDCDLLCDADGLQFARWSRRVARISLRRCSKITFVLLYELIRIAKDKRTDETAPLSVCDSLPTLVLDIWLCQGIPAEFVQQLQKNPSTRQLVRILGPGCSFVQASAQAHKWLHTMNSSCLQNNCLKSNSHGLCCGGLLLLSKDAFKTDATPKEMLALKPQLAMFPLTVIPVFCGFPRSLRSNDRNADCEATVTPVLIPFTVDDFVKLMAEYESSDTIQAVQRQIASGVLNDSEVLNPNSAEQQPDDLELRAQRVFAMLHKTTQDLENQVAHLEEQVKVMTLAKDAAQKEYLQAQDVLDQIAKDANRAILSLANESLPPPPAPVCDSIILKDKDGDDLLPELPSLDQIYTLGQKLETESFAVLDSFLGRDLSSLLRSTVDELYEKSKANSFTEKEAENQAIFTRGELAGGKTGKNLRYQMTHVRGDYVLWIDGFDLFCPPTVREVLRQIDRLVLERLPRHNTELGRASLMRKKAMITCYPGHQTRYTKHCDNPNQNGRKLTAILYLNSDWQCEHGGELLLHLPQGRQHRIEPKMDRLLLFFSDRRVPHEVLPCLLDKHRFALTVWYLDYDEFMTAQVLGQVGEDGEQERKRIEEEIQTFQTQI